MQINEALNQLEAVGDPNNLSLDAIQTLAEGGYVGKIDDSNTVVPILPLDDINYLRSVGKIGRISPA